ncbi:PREDICTED: uncharacterized protein LOC108363428 [Rhagoletis zephyria]|uniref:uncharacterized protein LOC108363428 n=1 Tax=Rhagoletis zephyria TaxID=28612 RepID=UPI0008119B8F|nr:PREDICTED: uncharacterized protein LOC108363428 [Rhagoletis zephyria]
MASTQVKGSKIMKRKYDREHVKDEHTTPTTDNTPIENAPTDDASTGFTVDSEYFENVLRLLREVVEKQNQLEQRLNNEMVTKAEFAAHNKMLSEMKVATKK